MEIGTRTQETVYRSQKRIHKRTNIKNLLNKVINKD